jgi:folylpolyglutamate synthase/dihydropteroate synthase
MLMTKDAKGMVETLLPLVGDWLVTQPHVLGKPSVPPQQVAEIVNELSPQAKVKVYENVRDGLEEALTKAGPRDVIVVTGSLYLVGEARERWFPTENILADLENRS